ncbi:MAG: NADAR family protein [Cyanobacteria bacterium P01_D01_bin.36]
MPQSIYFYTKNDPYFELSNFYPQGFEEAGKYWPSVEHYFQGQKFDNAAYREKIRTSGSPKNAKTLGQSREYKLRDDWEAVKDDIMLHALRQKFRHPKLRQLLLETNDNDLIENSPYDKYWGIGQDGQGQNRLGKLLMQVRSEIQNDSE